MRYDAVTQRNNQHRRRRGFTLTEVMIAMGVFILGMSAVAAIFPAGILLQQRTQDRVLSRHVADSAQSTILGSGVQGEDLSGTGGAFDPDEGHDLTPIHNLEDQSATGSPEFWPIGVRSYPSDVSPANAGYVWIPMIRDRDRGTDDGERWWQLYACVLKRDPNATYGGGNTAPGLENVSSFSKQDETAEIGGADKDTFKFTGGVNADEFAVGDQIIDNEGRVFTVVRVNTSKNSITVNGRVGSSDSFWYAPPPDGGGASPMQRIIAIPSADLFE
jgi:prepilin-type N-terminal cleavage/methylation domain-containing protein